MYTWKREGRGLGVMGRDGRGGGMMDGCGRGGIEGGGETR